MPNKSIVAVIVVAMLSASGAYASAERNSSEATSVQACVKDGTGQVRVLEVASSSCGPAERLTSWVVGGEITGLTAGAGLRGGGTEGPVALEVDPELVQSRVASGCAGGGAIARIDAAGAVTCADPGGEIVAGFDDGPGWIHGAGENGVAPLLASLNVPAGSYAVSAKLTLGNESPLLANSSPIRCELRAGADFDEAMTIVEEPDFDLAARPSSTFLTGLSLLVVHRFTEPGAIELRCENKKIINEFLGSPVYYEDLKIVAVQGSGISNVYLGTP